VDDLERRVKKLEADVAAQQDGCGCAVMLAVVGGLLVYVAGWWFGFLEVR
jgi:hypothetical protein